MPGVLNLNCNVLGLVSDAIGVKPEFNWKDEVIEALTLSE